MYVNMYVQYVNYVMLWKLLLHLVVRTQGQINILDRSIDLSICVTGEQKQYHFVLQASVIQ